ncbi:hypothetical protein [Streptomyces sp. NPDC018031]|uniref:hypothetical protein n=1 Tax=Streptomyces sp. NPDC018031 TaxID=3365033 RepID=UPI0037972C38
MTGAPAAPEVDTATLTQEQLKGWYCALCRARLFADRSIGTHTVSYGSTEELVELWACAPSCEAAEAADDPVAP